MISDVKTEIKNLIEPIISGEGFELVEIKLSRYQRNYRLQIFVDSATGINLDECAHLSRLIGSALDVGEILEAKYVLELSSPGLDRPLMAERDYKRRIGEEVKIEFMEKGRKKRVRGKLTAVDASEVVLNGEDGEVRIALDKIEQGKVII